MKATTTCKAGTTWQKLFSITSKNNLKEFIESTVY